jgi:hypothetical protein
MTAAIDPRRAREIAKLADLRARLVALRAEADRQGDRANVRRCARLLVAIDAHALSLGVELAPGRRAAA